MMRIRPCTRPWADAAKVSAGNLLAPLLRLAVGFVFALSTTQALELISAQTRGNPEGVTVLFSAPLDAATATNAANYAIDHGVAVTGVALIGSAKVRLDTSPIVVGQVYTLTVNQVRDAATPPSTIAPGSQVAFLQTQGVITRREFHDLPGYTLADLTNSARFPDTPDLVTPATELETPANVRDRYGVQLQGYVTAPLTGDYVFYVCSDDQGALFLSTDDNPANRQLIALEPAWSNPRQWITSDNFNSRLLPPADFFADALFIEAEDFNFDAGQSVCRTSIGMTGPYAGGSFQNLGTAADADIDWHEENPGNESPSYRGGTGVETLDMSSQAGSLHRGTFELSVDYELAWNDPGDWFNYTRSFPEPSRDYYVLARLSSGGADIAAKLDEVTAGATGTSQTTVQLGEFQAPATGGWGNYVWVPLRDEAGQLARVNLGGERTLRFTVLPGNLNFDYLLFKPARAEPLDLSPIRPVNVSAPIPLIAGHRYYLEALMKEASGGDNLAVAWAKPGDPPLHNGDPPIPGAFLSGVEPLAPVTITTPPQTQTVGERDSVTFGVSVTGTPPYDFQWFRNGQMIVDASGPSYTLDPAQMIDHGTAFHVLVGNGISSVSSDTALLTVTADSTPPSLVSAHSVFDGNQVIVRFSEPLLPTDATDVGHFQLDGGLTVTAASLDADGRTVTLETSPQTSGATYTLTVNDLRDTAASPNLIAPDSTIQFQAWVSADGFLRLEVFRDIPGMEVSDLVHHPRFPTAPDEVRYVCAFEAPSGLGANLGVRLTGFLTAPATGDYVFYLCATRTGELYLSPDASATKKVLIAADSTWAAERFWTTPPGHPRGAGNVSSPIPLVAGQRYYVEALMKNASDYATLGVAWQPPGAPVPPNGSDPIPWPPLSTYADPGAAAVTITDPPVDASVAEGKAAVFRCRATGAPGQLAYQWQRNQTDIPGATHQDYATPPATASDDGAKYRCRVTAAGAAPVFSSEATLHVSADTFPPLVRHIEGSVGRTRVTLRFHEPLDPVPANNSASYALSGGLELLGARLDFDGRTVVLNTSPQTPGLEYTVTLNSLRDRLGNVVPADTTATFIGWESEEFCGPFASWADVKRDYGAVGDGVADDTATIQRAFEELGNTHYGPGIGSAGGPAYVLYFPAGTYRITRTLQLFSKLEFHIAGQHPDTTRIVWDGAADGVMCWFDNVGQTTVRRLTFDGAGQALSAIDVRHSPERYYYGHCSTGNEFTDLVLRGVKYGFRGGNPDFQFMDSEQLIERCHFLGCAEAAIRLDSFNSLDWWVWDSLFDGCKIGYANPGGGACHIYRSFFRGSTEADIVLVQCCGFASYRWNTSVGSRRFIHQQCGDLLTVHGNTIIDTLESTAILATTPHLLLLDNVFRSRPEHTGLPVISSPNHILSAGNVFSTSQPFDGSGRHITVDDQIVGRDQIQDAELELPPCPPQGNRPVFEISRDPGPDEPELGLADLRIQRAIDQAAQLVGQRPVIHVPFGSFYLQRPLVIPANADFELIGDGGRGGGATVLAWKGLKEDPVVRILGPTRVSMREVVLRLADVERGSGLEISGVDQPGSRVFFKGVNLGRSLFDALDFATIESRAFVQTAWGDMPEDYRDVILVGGPRTKLGEATGASTRFWGGSGGATGLTAWDVRDGARLLVTDFWNETGPPRYLFLDGEGTITLNGMNLAASHWAPTLKGDPPTVEVQRFRGRFSLLNATLYFSGNEVLWGSGSDQALGLFCGVNGGEGFFLNDPAGGANAWFALTGHAPPVGGLLNEDYLRDMLRHLREERPTILEPLPADVADIRIERVTHLHASPTLRLTKLTTISARTNTPPVFTPVPDSTVHLGHTFTVAVQATDAEAPCQHMRYRLSGDNPPGATIDAVTGVLTWTPGPTLGNGTYRFRVFVEDDGAPALESEVVFHVTVLADSGKTALATASFDAAGYPYPGPHGDSFIHLCKDSVSPGWFNGSGRIHWGDWSLFTSRGLSQFFADDNQRFDLRSRTVSRDHELDVWEVQGETYLRLTEDGTAIRFYLNQTDPPRLSIDIVRNVDETGSPDFQYYGLWRTNLVEAIPGYRRTDTDNDTFTFGVEGFDIYARWNGVEFLRFKEYRHMQPGAVGLKTFIGYPLRHATARFYADLPLHSDPPNLVLDLRDFGLRQGTATGSIDAGSYDLLLDAAPEPPFRPGDWIIVETGGEAGQGRRGTRGVGGVWPQLHYPDAAARDADTTQPLNTYAWIETDGSVWQWDGALWQDRAHVPNDVGTVTELYHVAKAVPFALRAAVVEVSPDGRTLRLDEPAQATATGTTVHFDNSPILNLLAISPIWQPFGDKRAITPAGITLKIPAGRFAVGDLLRVADHAAVSLVGMGADQTTLCSPRGVPSLNLEFFGVTDGTVASLRLVGNALDEGFGFAFRNPRLPFNSPISQTQINDTWGGYWGSGGITFITSDHARVRDVLLEDILAPAVFIHSAAHDCWLERVRVIRHAPKMDEPLPLLFWTAQASGGGAVDLDLDVPNLAVGLGVWNGSDGKEFTRVRSRNATCELINAGSVTFRDCVFRLDPNAHEGMDGYFNAGYGMLQIDGPDVLVENVLLEQTGPLNARGDLLPGICGYWNSRNLRVIGGCYSTPPFTPNARSRPVALLAGDPGTYVEGFRASGDAGGFNVYVADGLIRDSWFDHGEVGVNGRIENCWPDSNLPPFIGRVVTNAQQTLTASVDIGEPGNPLEPGSATLLPEGSLEMVGGGLSDPLNDHLHFAFRECTGDFDAMVRVQSLDASNPAARAGLMFREDLDVGAVQVSVTHRGDSHVFGSVRPQAGDTSREWGWASSMAPPPHAWLRLVRQGQALKSFIGSLHGWFWEERGEVSLPSLDDPAGDPLLLGLFVTSEDNHPGVTARAVFSNMRILQRPALSVHEVTEATPIDLTFTATDFNHPPQQLTWSLAPGAPADAAIDPATGRFQWTPSAGIAPTAVDITVQVTDNGSPPLSDAFTFQIQVEQIVEPPLPVTLSNFAVHDGLFQFNFAAQLGKTYRVQVKATLDSPDWLDASQRTAEQPTFQFAEPLPTSGTRYYRVITQE